MSDSFAEFARELRPEVETELDHRLPAAEADPERLHRAMRYCVFAGGKRIRPALVVLAGETFGAERATLLPCAAALEMIHTFSLVHDDLPALDDDNLRRGRATVHREFDEATAVLVGDALLGLGLLVLMRHPRAAPAERRLEAAAVVAEAVGKRRHDRWPDGGPRGRRRLAGGARGGSRGDSSAQDRSSIDRLPEGGRGACRSRFFG